MSTILDTQYLLINRDGYDYKVDALTLGSWTAGEAGEPEKPWLEHIDNGNGGVFHIINYTDDVLYLSSGPDYDWTPVWPDHTTGKYNESYGSYGPFQAYSIEGEDLGTICSVPALGEVIIETGKNATGLFSNNPDIEWGFGEETNTIHVTNMEFMFYNSNLFNADISDWNTGSVRNMNSMFNGAENFNQNLGQWCVTLIGSEPDRFAKVEQQDVVWTLPKPPWGTCPGSEREIMPWDGYDGGIWHIKNVEHASLILDRHSGPYTAWDIDGTNEREIHTVAVGEELVFVSSPNTMQLFGDVTPGMENNSITDWEFGKYTDTSKVIDFTRHFAECHKFTGPLGGNWDTSHVESMALMFIRCTSFNEPIGHWDTSNVTEMNSMFWAQRSALDISNPLYEPGIFNQDISGWDVSNVTDMEYMFLRQTSFNQDLSNWCVTNITSEPTDFDQGASAWTEDKPVWGTCPTPSTPSSPCARRTMPWDGHEGGIWHIKNVEHDVLALKNAPYTAWDVDGTNQREISEVAIGEELVFVTSPTEAGSLFENHLTTDWEFGEYTDTSKVTTFIRLFYHCFEFSGPLGGNWDTSSVTTMANTFDRATSFNEPIGHWDTSNVTDMGLMFYGRHDGEDAFGYSDGIFNQDISGWDVSNVEYMWNMFHYQTSFNQDLSDWCVTKHPIEPSRFAHGAIAWEDENKPVWGTCPRGEDLNG